MEAIFRSNKEKILNDDEYLMRYEKRKKTLRNLVPFMGLVFLVLFFQLISEGRLLTVQNIKIIFNQMFFVTICATGATAVVAQGNLDLSIGAVVGLSAAAGAFMANINPLLAIPAALATGLLIGFINGFLHASLGINATVATLSGMFVYRGILAVTTLKPINVPVKMFWIDNLVMKVAVVLVVLAVGYIMFEYTKIGKHSRAIGCGIDAATQAGINVKKKKYMAFMISGLFAAVAGFFAMIRTGSVVPLTGAGLEMEVLIAFVIGGMPLTGGANTKIRSVLIGSLMIAVLGNGLVLWGLSDTVQQGIKGVVFLLSVALSFEREGVSVIK